MMLLKHYPGVQSIFIVYFVCLILYVLLPGRVVDGYCCQQSNGSKWRRSTYKLNGFSTIVVATAAFLQLPNIYKTVLYNNFWESLIAANVIGLVVSLIFFIFGGDEKYARCVTFVKLQKIDSLSTSTDLPARTPLQKFYLGQRWNPRIFYGLCDVKMLFYCIGAVALWINILSAVYVHQSSRGNISLGMYTYLICFGWFICEYMLGEEGKVIVCLFGLLTSYKELFL